MLTQCGARITQAYDKHTRTWSGFAINLTEYAKKCSSPCHHIDTETENPQSLHLRCLELRALNGRPLWLGMQRLPRFLAPLSLLMWQTPQATVDTTYEVNMLVRKNRLCGPKCHSKSVLIILLRLSRTHMLGGPLDQTALRKGDSWSSSQTPSCRKAKNQTCP